MGAVGEHSTGSKRALYAMFALVVISSAMGNLSQTAVNAMLPAMAGDFGVSVVDAQWLTSAYMLMLGVVVPLSAFLEHRLGIKKLVLLALVLFALGGVVDVASISFAFCLMGRILQAAASGILLPLIQTISVTRFPRGKQATAMGVAGIAMGFAPNIGPTIGGAFVEAAGWRAFFVFMSAIALVLALLVVLFVVNDKRDFADSPSTMSLDSKSFVLSALGFTGVLLGFSNASSVFSAPTLVLVPLVLGAVFLALFVARQQRVENPLVDMRVFASSRYTDGFVTQALLFASFMGITLIVALFVEDLQGGSSLEAGMALLPGTVVALIFNPLAGVLSDKIGVRKVCLVGGAFLVAGALAASFMNEATSFAAVAAIQGLRATGVSTLIGPLTSWSLSDLDHRIVGDGSSFSVVVRQATASFGTAIMVFAIAMAPMVGLPTEMGYRWAFVASAVFAVATFGYIVARVK